MDSIAVFLWAKGEGKLQKQVEEDMMIPTHSPVRFETARGTEAHKQTILKTLPSWKKVYSSKVEELCRELGDRGQQPSSNQTTK